MASLCRRTVCNILATTARQGSVRQQGTWSQRKVQHLTRLMSTESTSQQPIPDPTVKLSDNCIRKLKELGQTKSKYLRVVVDGGGCSGFEYKFSMDNEVQGDDKVFEREGVKVVIDMDTLEYLKGSTIDYHEELIRSSFRVIDNPQAEQGCSCGASFSLK